MADDRENEPGAERLEPRAEEIHPLEVWLSHVLRGGVIASTLLVAAGLVLMFHHQPELFSGAVPAEAAMRAMAFPHTMAAVFAGMARGEGRSVILVGLFVLIATPVMRVAVSAAVFLHQRDRLFAVITLIVLGLLLTSFVLGRAGG